MTHAEISKLGGVNRWKGVPKEKRREHMSELAKKRHAKKKETKL